MKYNSEYKNGKFVKIELSENVMRNTKIKVRENDEYLYVFKGYIMNIDGLKEYANIIGEEVEGVPTIETMEVRYEGDYYVYNGRLEQFGWNIPECERENAPKIKVIKYVETF